MGIVATNTSPGYRDQSFHGGCSLAHSFSSVFRSRSVSIDCQNPVVLVGHQLAVSGEALEGFLFEDGGVALGDVFKDLGRKNEEPAVDPGFVAFRFLHESLNLILFAEVESAETTGRLNRVRVAKRPCLR